MNGFRIPHSRPSLSGIQLEKVQTLLESGHLARGRICREVETRFRESFLTNSWQAHTVLSGTLALELVLRALISRLPAKHSNRPIRVVIPTLVCAALYQAVRAVGAIPVLCDANPDGNPDLEQFHNLLQQSDLGIFPHLYGKPVDLSPLGNRLGQVIEDCAQSLGVTTNNRPVGTTGKVMISSFYATKLLCSGQGGIVASNETELIRQVVDLCAYDGREGSHYRTNGNLSDWSACLLLPQIEQFRQFETRRQVLAQRYTQAFLPYVDRVTLPKPSSEGQHAWYRYVVLVEDDSEAWSEKLAGWGIESKHPVFCPLHQLFGSEQHFPVAEKHWRQSLSLPLYPTLSDLDQDEIIERMIHLLTHC